tara:strand:- start:349 stop:774 length:426 start_codon:yes stop_codon:yes gene_type:complete
MKESTWKQCIETHSSLKVSPDKGKINSLVDTAMGRNTFFESNEINENNSNYIFEGYYSSMLEILHALLLHHGYKVTNHICLGYYLRDVLHKDALFRMFDDCRYKRNSLVYYGRKMDFETATFAIEKCKELFEEIKNILDNK